MPKKKFSVPTNLCLILVIGMVGFVKYRRAAKKNWNERQEYEDLIKQKTLEKKLARQKMDLDATNGESGGKFY